MPYRIMCPKCNKKFDVSESAAGRTAKCNACGEKFRVPEMPAQKAPTANAETKLPPADDTDWDALLQSPEAEAPGSDPLAPRAPSRRKAKTGFPWGIVLGVGIPVTIVGVVVLVCCGFGGYFAHWFGEAVEEREKEIAQEQAEMAKENERLDAIIGSPDERFTWPTEEEIPIPRSDHPIAVDGVARHIEVKLPVKPAYPGYESTINVFTPPVEASPGSLPCVFISASRLGGLAGSRISDWPVDWEPTLSEFAREGPVVIVQYDLDGAFSLDEAISPDGEFSGEFLRGGFRLHLASRGGMVNARNAVEFALDNIPAIDPERLGAMEFAQSGEVAILHGLLDSRIKRTYSGGLIADLEDYVQSGKGPASKHLDADSRAHVPRLSLMTYVDRAERPVTIGIPRNAHEQNGYDLIPDAREFQQRANTAAGRKIVEVEIIDPASSRTHIDAFIDKL